MNLRLARPWLALCLICVAPAMAGAADPAPSDPHADALRRRLEALQQQEAAEDASRAAWQQRERELLEAIENARAHLAETEENRTRAHDGAYGGVKRSEWTQRSKEARKALAEAERQLEEFHEEARREDVPPGWLEAD
jgi:hypothetical protein